jgi:uncharacterized phage protein (TIGR02220 family)
MNILISESPLQVLPTLAMQVGLNEAIILQQLHSESLISTNVRDGHTWVYKTYDEWKNEDFPYWCVDTIKRAIRRLEDSGYIIATASYNRMKMDKTKCYRINYEKLQLSTEQHATSTISDPAQEEVQTARSTESKLPLAITKEVKRIKIDIVENDLDVVSVIEYLNDKANKQYKASAKPTVQLVNARFSEGYTVADFKKVIDTKAKEWLNDPHWQKYLRPSTLFNSTNFENYLQESGVSGSPPSSLPKPFELDFSEGEA